MRIIGGDLKGQSLVAFKAGHIRPTTDRVKETIFNILINSLGTNFENLCVVDGFAGTGSLGIECISRGCRDVTFVENHPKSLNIIKKNLSKLKIQDGYEIHQSNIFQFLKRADQACDLLLLDPPFTEKMADRVMQSTIESSILADSTTIVIESSAQELIKQQYGDWICRKPREFGDKKLSIFTKAEVKQ